jgi:membrane-associated phospholipid phosphatase
LANALWDALSASLMDLNFLYYGMGLVSVLGLALATTFAVRGGALAEDSRWARHVARMRACVPAVVVLSLTTLAAGLQGGFERAVQQWHGWDFTPLAYAVEGHAVEWVQDTFRHPALDYVLVTVYTVGAFSLYFTPFFILVALGRSRSAMRVAATMAGVWAVGILFYFFFPVYEVWTTADPAYGYGWTHVQPILFEYLPDARDSWGYQTALNNNFPSLHVALSAGIAMSLWLAREKWLAVPSTVVAAGVALATVYLGIHWIVDVVAGLALCAGSAWLVHRRVPLEERTRVPVAGRPVSAEPEDLPPAARPPT